MLIKKFFLFTSLLFITISAFANSEVDKVILQQYASQYLSVHRVDEHISAISLTLKDFHHSSPVSVYAGYTSFNNQTPVGEHNLFHIGSITKSFTAAIILQLDGDPDFNFSINDRIEKYFPQYKNWRGITIKQLMNMTSGIPDYLTNQDFISDLIANPYRDRTNDELLNYSYQLNLRFEPGTQYDYSNANYVLLGMLIEKVTGHTLEYEMKTRLFSPLKLAHTFYFSGQLDKEIYPYLVRSYMYKKITNDFIPMGTDTTDFTLSFFGASGGIIATSYDINRWINELFTPGKILTKKQLRKLTSIVSTQTGRRLKLPTNKDPNGYGLGVIYSYFPDIGEYGFAYEGITFAGRAAYIYIPKRNVIISATVNSSVNGDIDNPDHLKNLLISVYKSISSIRHKVVVV